MPVPTRQRVAELLSAHARDVGFVDGDLDIEDVTVSKAGSRSVVKVIVDRDAGFELDAIARLSHEISDILDAATEFGDAPYTLEVTTPGIDRPITEPRHWRRARGRMATVVVQGETVVARIGRLVGEDGESAELDLVLGSRSGPYVRTVPLADIESVTVQVEFRKPNPAELELAGGVVPGRFDPTNPPDEPVTADDTDESDDTDDESR